ncbi:MAG: galactose-1-phosphate uridylyltransferase [Gemmataceae bacterium]
MTAPQLRKDPVVDRWVFVSPERGARPLESRVPPLADRGGPCPFCEGQERETPHEIAAVRDASTLPDSPGWQVRVVPNMYPAARIASTARSRDDELFAARPGVGVHEVVLECPRHETSFARLSVDQARRVFDIYRQRLRALTPDERLAYVQVFKNHGAGAGASVTHAHSQILGLALVPRELRAEYGGAEAYHARHGHCIYCDLIARETASGERLVWAGEHVVAVCAWAGRFPYETWVLPRRHGGHFADASAAEMAEVAEVMHRLVARIGELVEDPPYNYLLHELPLRAAESPAYHWHWELLPRLTGVAGFELAGGTFLNPLPPEEAAARLRS